VSESTGGAKLILVEYENRAANGLHVLIWGGGVTWLEGYTVQGYTVTLGSRGSRSGLTELIQLSELIVGKTPKFITETPLPKQDEIS
jgi:hypothetical protein